MRFTKITAVLFALSACTVSSFAQEELEIDPVHTNVNFTVRHMVVAKVSGTFKEVAGTIMYDEKDLTKSAVKVAIKTASISTQNDRRDNHLRSADFFDAATDSVITFVSKSIKKSGDGYIATGDLTLRGVTKTVDLPFQILGVRKEARGTYLGIEAALTIDRFDYGVKWDRKLDDGNLVVGKDVQININVEARPPRKQ
ncbi:MAG: Protein YceI [bacterium]|nr:Protein YceI [bacterium]